MNNFNTFHEVENERIMQTLEIIKEKQLKMGKEKFSQKYFRDNGSLYEVLTSEISTYVYKIPDKEETLIKLISNAITCVYKYIEKNSSLKLKSLREYIGEDGIKLSAIQENGNVKYSVRIEYFPAFYRSKHISDTIQAIKACGESGGIIEVLGVVINVPIVDSI